jgi:serine phosphatase RsbU (regulator of sigma subunit)
MQSRPSAPVPIDFRRLFDAVPQPLLVLDLDLRVVEANPAYCAILGRSRQALVGREAFSLFPDNPDDPAANGVKAVRTSMEAARDTGQTQVMPLQRYDIEDPDTAAYSERYWSIVNVPVLDDHGATVLLLNRVEDVTAYVMERVGDRNARGQVENWKQRVEQAEADVYARARELQAAWAAEADASRRLAALAGVAVELSTAQTVQEITGLVIERGLAALGADGGAVAVLAEGDVLDLTITESLGAQTVTTYAKLPLHGPLPACVATASGDRVLLPDRAASLAFSPQMTEVMADTGCQAFASLPLHVGGRILGSLTVAWTGTHTFPAREVEILDAFAAHCAHGIERITARQVERAAAAATTRLAETLQMSLLTDPAQPDHLQTAVRYRPAAHDAKVGGDWYDAFLTAKGELSLVIGDVAGHDRDAVAAMGQLRNLLRGISYTLDKPPAPILTALDTAIGHFAVDTLATAIVAQVEQTVLDKVRGRRRFRWSNAGHPPPLLLHPEGTAELLHTTPELLLGVRTGRPRTDHVTDLPVGCTLLLYTDGLVERRGETVDDGLDRLVSAAEALSGYDLEEFCDALIDRMSDDGGTAANDDIALLALRAHDPDQPRPPEAGPERLH